MLPISRCVREEVNAVDKSYIMLHCSIDNPDTRIFLRQRRDDAKSQQVGYPAKSA